MGRRADGAAWTGSVPIDVGDPGASARARYEQLVRHDGERRRARFGRLSPLVGLLAGPRREIEVWRQGSDGEVRVGHRLTGAVGTRGVVFHDRRIGRSRANVDHIVVVPSGVWVVDAKRYRGRLRRWGPGGLLAGRGPAVGGRDLRGIALGVRRQRALVAEHVRTGVPVRAALCFTGVERSLLARPFVVDGVLVSWPGALTRTVLRSGALDADTIESIASTLARAFPPYAPAGTSQRPTGAPPSG